VEKYSGLSELNYIIGVCCWGLSIKWFFHCTTLKLCKQ